MLQLPTLVQDLPVTRLTNAVLVGHCLFTKEQIEKSFTTERPMPERLREQLKSYNETFNKLDDTYAMTLRNVITDEIKALNHEGDQLILAVQNTFTAAKRMIFMPDRQKAGYTFWEFWRKYKIDTRENMFAEWSKVQQVVDESVQDFDFAAATTTLGLTSAMKRLGEIAAAIRQRVTDRSAELPELRAMKLARKAMYPEYRALILVLNAFVLIEEDFAAEHYDLIEALNNNIAYTRQHAITKSATTPSPDGDTPADDSSATDSSASADEDGKGSPASADAPPTTE